jgi:stage V sporulation protein R
MYLIDQHAKKIMEGCKILAHKAGLQFDKETLEYIVTNIDMIELSPKVMIPTLYDYWVNDVEVLVGKGQYEVYPNNPYETVINSRPAISFYNDNNPDWLNVMIFYHVLGHIDFFQNNIMFQNTWNDDFVGQALADKRLIADYRSTYGRWADYIIEFSRSIDNLSGYFETMNKNNYPHEKEAASIVDYYFNEFLQKIVKSPDHIMFNELGRYNDLYEKHADLANVLFFTDVKKKYPEFQSHFDKFLQTKTTKKPVDIIEFIINNSKFLNKEENIWMKAVITVVRNTSLYFNPQIRTKITNEGWASYWHDKLFRQDSRIIGHEIAFAKTNAAVTSISRVGLNPYAIGLRLIQYIEDKANKGQLNYQYQRITSLNDKIKFDKNTNEGQKAIFNIRKNFSDFMLINTFVDQEFVDQHDLFVTGKRYNEQRQTIEYYVKSRKAEDYKQMLLNSLYHPPTIVVDEEKTTENNLYLVHKFENKQLVKEFISDTLLGIEYLWGNPVQLETTDIYAKKDPSENENKFEYRRVLYTINNKQVAKQNI